MFTITFYSYKGGVGRTMGLVNVAADLAQRGRKVLIIDFDLEAPGIPSFKAFSASDSRVGIVDYVTEYIDTSIAPNVSDYIVEANLETTKGQVPLWVFPAGRRDENYSQKLSSIDWQDLYESRSGYLLFEDLKQQVQADIRKFDYVLIDSRTGHTDVGGICTRQLADAITFMFFPNIQNISGLETIVSEIRKDRHVGSKQTKMLFCPSNVPDLDDEDGILRAMLEDASKTLGYEKPSATIRHYNSLSLVDQKIFVVDRPNTKLAAEYRELTEALVQWNLEDRDGALLALRRFRNELRLRSKNGSRRSDAKPIPLNELVSDLNRITSIHRNDGEVCWRIAALHHELGDFASELDALNGSIEAGFQLQKAYLKRALILLSQSRRDEAKADLLQVIESPMTEPMELRSVIEAVKTFDPDWVDLIARSPLLEKLLPEEVGVISNGLLSDARGVKLALKILIKGYHEANDDNGARAAIYSDLVLSFISSGRFVEAMETISDSRDAILSEGSIDDVFNFAMAEWGATGTAPVDLSNRVLELGNADPEPNLANFYQCLALASAIVGETNAAIDFLGRAKSLVSRGIVFSCWRYLYGGRTEMLADIDAMGKAVRSDRIFPPFLMDDAQPSYKLN